jgi:hypothetical protein
MSRITDNDRVDMITQNVMMMELLCEQQAKGGDKPKAER